MSAYSGCRAVHLVPRCPLDVPLDATSGTADGATEAWWEDLSPRRFAARSCSRDVEWCPAVSGCGVFAELDGYSSALVVEHGDQFEACAERLEGRFGSEGGVTVR